MKIKILATLYTILLFVSITFMVYVIYIFPHRVIPVIAIIAGIMLIISVWNLIYRNLK